MKRLALLVAVGLLVLPVATYAGSRGGSSHSSSKTKSKSKSSGEKAHKKKDGTHVDAYDRSAPKSHGKCTTCQRDGHGRIERSEKAKGDFMKQSGYPDGRPGYVVDHVRALECGGPDVPSNMQWQTVADAKAKDHIERKCN
jgi:hypothetical protein